MCMWSKLMPAIFHFLLIVCKGLCESNQLRSMEATRQRLKSGSARSSGEIFDTRSLRRSLSLHPFYWIQQRELRAFALGICPRWVRPPRDVMVDKTCTICICVRWDGEMIQIIDQSTSRTPEGKTRSTFTTEVPASEHIGAPLDLERGLPFRQAPIRLRSGPEPVARQGTERSRKVAGQRRGCRRRRCPTNHRCNFKNRCTSS